MQTYTSENPFASELAEGEELLWFGRPQPRGKSTSSPRTLYMVSGICGLLGLILLIAGGFRFTGNPSFIASTIIGAFLIYIAFIVFIVGFFTFGKRSSTKNVAYAITDRRVIIARSGRLSRVDSYSHESIQQVRRIERSDESGDILFATRAGSPYGNNIYYNHILNGQGTLTALANVRQVEKMLIKMLK